MTTPSQEKIVAGLARYTDHIRQSGAAYVKLYPPGKMPEAIYEQITVPVPLPIVLLLYTLALSHVRAAEPQEVKPT